MSQDPNDMLFCESCKMNVYPSRPQFNMIAFGVCAVIIFIPVILITMFIPFSGIFFFLYFMWGFMVINPYLIYYGIQQKRYCPRCKGKCIEKNLEYQPFGPKFPEPFRQSNY